MATTVINREIDFVN